MPKRTRAEEELSYQQDYAMKAKKRSSTLTREGKKSARQDDLAQAVFDRVIESARSPNAYKGATKPKGKSGASGLLEGLGVLRAFAKKTKEGFGSLQDLAK